MGNVVGEVVETEACEVGEVVEKSDECVGCDIGIPQAKVREGVLKSREYFNLLREPGNGGGKPDKGPELAERGQKITEVIQATLWFNDLSSWGYIAHVVR